MVCVTTPTRNDNFVAERLLGSAPFVKTITENGQLCVCVGFYITVYGKLWFIPV